MFKYSIVAVFLLSVIANAAVRKAPYLILTGGDVTMTVLWQSGDTHVDTLWWGVNGEKSETVLSTEYGNDHQHRYGFKNLKAGVRYAYRISAGDTLYNGSFLAPPDHESTSLKFFAYGDTRSNPDRHDSVAAAINRVIAGDPSWQTMIVGVGDFVLDGDKEDVWTSEWFDPQFRNLRILFANVPYQSSRGNHEKSAKLFRKYYPYSSTDSCYWSFDFGPAHFTIVDEYVPFDSSSEQYRWIEQDLKSSTKAWKFLSFHEPAWSAGGGHINSKKAQKYLEPLCEKYGVPVVFGGHNHYYARAAVPTASGDTIQHVTVGGGGAPLYNPDMTQPYVVSATKVNSFGRIIIRDEKHLEFEAVDIYDKVIDRFEVVRK